jgi:hypothetical protein
MGTFYCKTLFAMIATVFPGMACGAAQGDEVLPCSQRYLHEKDYLIEAGDIGREAQGILSRWGIEGPHWGMERISVAEDALLHQPAMTFFYPRGSINPNNEAAPRGGASFYIRGGFESHVKAACLQYQVFFPADFAFAKGGKLPGLYGGRNEKGESASGCRPGVEEDGFSTRYMWREKGAGSLYAYLPGKSESCGKYIGKGSWHFTPGAWTTLEQEVVLNDPGSSNGTLRVWVNGKPVIAQPNVVLRNTDDISIDGIFFVSFFGGKEPEWASPKDQQVTFAGLKAFLP